MNHNPHNLEVGQTCWLDDMYFVIIKELTTTAMYATVYGADSTPDNTWHVMTARLTPLTTNADPVPVDEQ